MFYSPPGEPSAPPEEPVPTADLHAAREALVLRHVAAENAHDLDAVLATFAHPRYEVVPTGMVYDGAAAVSAMLTEQWRQLPWLSFEAVGLFHGESGLVVETRTRGTSPDGRAVDLPSVNIFGFVGEGLVLERCYYDRRTMAESLGLAPS
jgi:ketosteroid isomerase-like protein